MVNVTYDILWREAMMGLLDLLEAENPEDPSLAPSNEHVDDWAIIYIKYIQVFRKLEEAYDQVIHPQKRIDLRKALEATMGRILEIRAYLVTLNQGVDEVDLDRALLDLKLPPEALEIPVPKYFTEAHRKLLEDRKAFMLQMIARGQTAQATDESDGKNLVELPPPLPMSEAVQVIQVAERGRQGRLKGQIARDQRRMKALQDAMAERGVRLTKDAAAVPIQATIRGFIARRKVKRLRDEEMVFLGMKPRSVELEDDPSVVLSQVIMRRKNKQRMNWKEYEEALVVLKQRVREMEGQDMRETIQDKINAWFIENRDPETGDYPDFPDEDVGGSRVILNPPPVAPEEPEVDAKGAKDAKAKGKGKGKGDEDGEEEVKGVSTVFVGAIEEAVQEYVARWQDCDEAGNFAQKYDPELVKEELRPVVFEEVRAEVDTEMAVLLENLKDMVAAERAAKAGKKWKKPKKKKKKGKKDKKKGKKGKGPKDMSPDRGMESLFAEMVQNNLMQLVREVSVQDYVGAFNAIGSDIKAAGAQGDLSLAHVRQLVTEYCILPLGSQDVHARLPAPARAVLLYGPPNSGKKMLAHAIAQLSGSNFFNLSPRNTDGRFPAKQVTLMINTIFKVAKAMAPSVIFIDEIEKVFNSDKKAQREYGGTEPFSRIKKDFLKEFKFLQPGDRVLVVGCTSSPWTCAKKDKKVFVNLFDRHIYCPVPDYASRALLWPFLFVKHGGALEFNFDTSTLALLSEGYTSGDIDRIVRMVLSQRRRNTIGDKPIDMNEILQWMTKVPPVSAETVEQFRAWTRDLPSRQLPAEPTEDPKDAKKKKK
ncbi:unnamed protein product [Pedinophyceae sp. YPF-701]|nr:unnamed protein product [Pedinophyceae sp. YPF-701]